MPQTMLTRAVRVTPDPPQRPSRPWVRCTAIGFRVLDGFSQAITLGDVLGALRLQFGLSVATTAFIARIHSVKIWASPDVKTGAVGGPCRITASFYDPNETEGYAISQQADSGTAAVPAHVGLLYGDIRAQNLCDLGSVNRKLVVVEQIAVDPALVNTELTIHVDLEWAYATSV